MPGDNLREIAVRAGNNSLSIGVASPAYNGVIGPESAGMRSTRTDLGEGHTWHVEFIAAVALPVASNTPLNPGNNGVFAYVIDQSVSISQFKGSIKPPGSGVPGVVPEKLPSIWYFSPA